MDVFRNKYVRELRRELPSNLSKYIERKPWAHKPAESKLGANSIEPSMPLELLHPEGEDKKDFENALIVHRAFPTLTPLQARDPRLWTRLAHVECWGYMRARWDVGQHMADTDKAFRYALAHYFVPRDESRALLRNGIARLWWYAHLTHDTTRNNPYELTRVLLSSLDIAQQILERNMGRAPRILGGFLDFIRIHEERLGSNSGERRQQIRDLAKALNLRGGIAILDSMETNDVIAFLDSELNTS